MSKMNEFENILDECLQRLINGESIEACLSRYPRYRAELEPLLRTAQDTLKAADIKPRPEFRDRASYQFQTALREMPVKEKRGFFTLVPRWATVVSIVVIVLLAFGGTVAASFNSLPGEPLYQVKMATETVRLSLTPSDTGKAQLNAAFADERVDEIIRMAEKGDAERIEETTDRLNRQLLAVANLTVTGEAIMENGDFSALMAPAALTTAPVAVPSPTSTPTSTVGLTPPQVTPAPTPTVVSPPEEVFLGSEQAPGAEKALDSSAGGVKEAGSEQEKLRDILSRQSLENLRDLEEQLEKASESLKPALRHAIEVAARAYEEALAALGS